MKIAVNASGQIQDREKSCVPDINVQRRKIMNKYGQAEYAYGILQQISEKLLAEGILTEEQLKQLNALNKEGCFRQFCTALAA